MNKIELIVVCFLIMKTNKHLEIFAGVLALFPSWFTLYLDQVSCD